MQNGFSRAGIRSFKGMTAVIAVALIQTAAVLQLSFTKPAIQMNNISSHPKITLKDEFIERDAALSFRPLFTPKYAVSALVAPAYKGAGRRMGQR